VHDELAGTPVVGRVTGQEFARAKRTRAGEGTFTRRWFADGCEIYGVVLDAHGKIGWAIGHRGDPIVVVLPKRFRTRIWRVSAARRVLRFAGVRSSTSPSL